MTCFAPVSTKLRSTFFRLFDLDTTTTARSSIEKEILPVEVRVYHQMSFMSSNKEQLLYFQDLLAQFDMSSAFKMPVRD